MVNRKFKLNFHQKKSFWTLSRRLDRYCSVSGLEGVYEFCFKTKTISKGEEVLYVIEYDGGVVYDSSGKVAFSFEINDVKSSYFLLNMIISDGQEECYVSQKGNIFNCKGPLLDAVVIRRKQNFESLSKIYEIMSCEVENEAGIVGGVLSMVLIYLVGYWESSRSA